MFRAYTLLCCRRPGIGRVAAFTVIATGDMVTRFAIRCTVIVAGKTGANDFIMIDRQRYPACKAMAAFTDIRGSDVCR